MPAFRLVAQLALYYALLAIAVAALFLLVPAAQEHLPVGRVRMLVAQADGALNEGAARMTLDSFGGSMLWLVSAVVGALLASLPVSWVYMQVRNPDQYDQSLVDTIVVLPLVVTGVVVIVQDSLALSFSLAGIAGAVRFRNSLKSSGDLLFILLSIAIGLAAGIGALELAMVTSIIFNLCFVALWASEYGERKGMKRFLSDFDGSDAEGAAATVGVAAVALSVAVAEDGAREAKPERREQDDDD